MKGESHPYPAHGLNKSLYQHQHLYSHAMRLIDVIQLKANQENNEKP